LAPPLVSSPFPYTTLFRSRSAPPSCSPTWGRRSGAITPTRPPRCSPASRATASPSPTRSPTSRCGSPPTPPRWSTAPRSRSTAGTWSPERRSAAQRGMPGAAAGLRERVLHGAVGGLAGVVVPQHGRGALALEGARHPGVHVREAPQGQGAAALDGQGRLRHAPVVVGLLLQLLLGG